MIRVYVAGCYNGKNVMDVLDNMRVGIQVCRLLIKHNFAPFCPWLDFQFTLSARSRKEAPTLTEYRDYSMAWMEVSDCVYVLPGWEGSIGARAEVVRAGELAIPVFECTEDLLKFRMGRINLETMG